MSRKSQKRCKSTLIKNALNLTYLSFLHTFLFSYDYFQILKLCGVEVGVDLENK